MLRQPRDYDRDRLHAPDHGERPQRVVLFNALMECERPLLFPRNIPCEMLNVSLSITPLSFHVRPFGRLRGSKCRGTLHSQGHSYMRVMAKGRVGAG